MTADNNKAVLDYVLVTVCELSDDSLKKIEKMGIALSMRKIMVSDDDYWANLVERKVIQGLEVKMIMAFRDWYIARRNDKIELPKDLEEWKQVLTPEALDDFVYRQKAKLPPAENTDSIMTSKIQAPTTDHFAVKINDFPDFNGKLENWALFKQKFEAIAALSNLTELLNVTDKEEHYEKREIDRNYDNQCKTLHQILRKVTAGGTALSKVLTHNSTQDGVETWYDLKNYYDQEGNSKTYGARLLGQLADLKLTYNSYGGMDKYISDFEKIALELERINPLDDDVKKTFFMRGIQDRDYIAKKDLCSPYDYRTTVLEMRNKAAELGKASGTGRSSRRTTNNTNTNHGKGGKGQKNSKDRGRNRGHSRSRSTSGNTNSNSDKQDKDNKDSDTTKGSFDPKVWKQLTPANREYIIQLKKLEKSVKYGQQYNNGPEPRRNNAATTTQEPDTPPTAPGEIWKPGFNVRRNNVLRTERKPRIPISKLEKYGIPVVKLGMNRKSLLLARYKAIQADREAEKRRIQEDTPKDPQDMKKTQDVPDNTKDVADEHETGEQFSVLDVQTLFGEACVTLFAPPRFYGVTMTVADARKLYPVELAAYATANALTESPGWTWAKMSAPIPRKRKQEQTSASEDSQSATMAEVPSLEDEKQPEDDNDDITQNRMGRMPDGHDHDQGKYVRRLNKKNENKGSGTKEMKNLTRKYEKLHSFNISKRVKHYPEPKKRFLNVKRTMDEMNEEEKDAATGLIELYQMGTHEENEQTINNFKIDGLKLHHGEGISIWSVKVILERCRASGEIIMKQEKWMTLSYVMRQIPNIAITYLIEKIPTMIQLMRLPDQPVDPLPDAIRMARMENIPYNRTMVKEQFKQNWMNYEKNIQKYERNLVKLNELLSWARQQRERRMNQYNKRYMDTARMFSKQQQKGGYEYAFIDSGADTFGIGGKAWIIDTLTDRTVEVSGYHKEDTVMNNIPIGTGITAVDLPNGETILLRAHEATIIGEHGNTLFSVPQMLENNVDVQDKSRRHGGQAYLECEGIIIPLIMIDAMLTVKIRRPTEEELENCEMIDITSSEEWHPCDINDDDNTEMGEDDYNKFVDEVEKRKMNLRKSNHMPQNPEHYAPYFLYPGKEIMKETLKNTTRYGAINMRLPMRQHYKARNPLLSRKRILEGVATDTWFSSVTSYEGYNCAQAFYGINSKTMSHYGMKSEASGPSALEDYFRQEGVPISLLRDNAKMEMSKQWNEIMRKFWVKDTFTEPYHSNQNPFERAFASHKEKLERVMIESGCDPRAWFKAACHVADVSNHTAVKSLGYRTPIEVRDGETPDISALCQFKFWELVYYQKHNTNFPSQAGTEGLGRWMGRAMNHGDKMCYYILDDETDEIIVRSMVRSAEETNRPNRGLGEEHAESQREQIKIMEQGNNFPIITYYDEDNTQELPGGPKFKHSPVVMDPEKLIDLYIHDTYTTRNGKERKMRGQVKEYLGGNNFRVTFDNGKNRHYDYDEIIRMVNKEDEDGAERWQFEEILDHRWSKERKGKIDLKIKWTGYAEPTWEPMEVIKIDDPVSVAKYAHDNGLTEMSMWKWAKRYTRNIKTFQRLQKQVKLNKKRTNTIKYQFGYRVPRTIKEAYKLDELNGNTKWKDAILTELKKLHEEYSCFKIVEHKHDIGEGYKYIPLLWAFAVKFDGRHRARCVAGGHITPDLEDDLYSGSVDLETVRIAFVAAQLTALKIIAADVGSAYIQAFTIEKVYTIAGPEWAALNMEGKILVIVKALYGLKSSGAMWHQKLADNLREMGYTPCEADYDFWIRGRDDHYEYVAVIVDDLLVFSRKPEETIGLLQQIYKYTLTGVGSPEYYNGADITFDNNGHVTMSAKTYIKNVTERIEKLMEITLKNYGSPMEAGDHPEMDESDLLVGTDIPLYQMLLGCAQWAVTLGRFDIQYATNTLARFGSVPREGHLKRCLRLFGYLKHNHKARIVFDPTNPNLEALKFENHDWTDLYPFAEEYISDKCPIPKTEKELAITAYVDASHATDLTTRRSVTGYIIFVGNSIIKWYSKRQNTVETSTYGSELVAMRIALEAILEIRYKLRTMGIKFENTSTILCDNQSVIYNTQFPTSSLKKKHNAVAFHKVREAIAAGIIRTAHIRSEHNVSDILTKAKGPADYYQLLKVLLFGRE